MTGHLVGLVQGIALKMRIDRIPSPESVVILQSLPRLTLCHNRDFPSNLLKSGNLQYGRIQR